jgi:hypothetical protein
MDSSKVGCKLPVCFWGIHGTGKTELVRQIAHDNGYNLVTLHLATQDICDLIGIPSRKVVDVGNGMTETIQEWSCPDWLFNAKKSYETTKKPNLFFLDEFNRGNRFVLAAMLPFLIDGVLHTHGIGPDDAVIAAANPANDKYEVSEIIDEALLNRLGHIVFSPTHEEYVNYLKSKKMDRTTLKVVANSPGYTKIAEFDLGFDVKPSRRSIFNVMSRVGTKSKGWIKEHASYVIEAYLGQAFRDEWLAEYQSKDESITLDMLRDFDNNAADIEAALVTTIDGETTHRTDILSKTQEIIKTFIADNKDKIGIEDVTWMIKFFSLKIIPDDTAAAVFMSNPIMKRAIMRDPKVNIALVNFLRKKKIINNDGTAPWAAAADGENT